MLQRLLGAVLLLTATTLVCADLRAQVPGGPGTPANPKDSSKMSAGEYTGVLKAVPGTDRMFTLTVTTQSLVPTGKTTKAPRMNIPGMPNLNNAYNNVALLQVAYVNQQNKIASLKQGKGYKNAYNKGVAKLAQIGTQLQQAVAAFQQAAALANIRNLAILNNASGGVPQFKIQTNKQDVDFQTTEAPKVRTLILPEVFDDKGEVKKYTAKEKAELKGKDKNLPGYESSIDKLEAGQTLTVTLVPVSKKKLAKEAEKDADAKLPVEEEKKMQVKMLVIAKEADGTTPEVKRKKKKKADN